jgi:hypothetical protein
VQRSAWVTQYHTLHTAERVTERCIRSSNTSRGRLQAAASHRCSPPSAPRRTQTLEEVLLLLLLLLLLPLRVLVAGRVEGLKVGAEVRWRSWNLRAYDDNSSSSTATAESVPSTLPLVGALRVLEHVMLRGDGLKSGSGAVRGVNADGGWSTVGRLTALTFLNLGGCANVFGVVLQELRGLTLTFQALLYGCTLVTDAGVWDPHRRDGCGFDLALRRCMQARCSHYQQGAVLWDRRRRRHTAFAAWDRSIDQSTAFRPTCSICLRDLQASPDASRCDWRALK